MSTSDEKALRVIAVAALLASLAFGAWVLHDILGGLV